MRVLDDSIQVWTFSGPGAAEALKAHYRSVRERMQTPRPKRLSCPQKPVEPPAIEPIDIPAFVPARGAEWFDVHDVPKITTSEVLAIVIETFSVGKLDLLSQRRRVDIAFARQVAMWMLRRFTMQSFPEIGRRIGNRDHTTVIHAACKINGIIEANGLTAEDTPQSWALALRPFQPEMPARWRRK